MIARKLGAAFVAVLAIGAIGAVMTSSAYAAPTTVKSHWISGGSKLSSATVKCSKASEKLSLMSEVAGSTVWLTASGVECVFGSVIESTTVGGIEMAVDSGILKFTGVTAMEPAGCTLEESTITTEALASNLEMDGILVYDRFAPTAPATRFAVVKLRECAAEGNYNVTGFVRGLSPNKTGEEKTNQKLIFNAVSNTVSQLKLGGNVATLEGEVNNELTSGANFSASE